MTKYDFIYSNIKNNGDIEAYTLLWLEDNGWYRPSSLNDGSQQPPFGTKERASNSLTAGVEIPFTNRSGETINIVFDNETQTRTILLNGQVVQDFKELLKLLAGVQGALEYLCEKLKLTEWGFPKDELDKQTPLRIRRLLEDYVGIWCVWNRDAGDGKRCPELYRWNFDKCIYEYLSSTDVGNLLEQLDVYLLTKEITEVYNGLLRSARVHRVTDLYRKRLPVANGDLNIYTGELDDPTPERFLISRLKAPWLGETHHEMVDLLFNGIAEVVDRMAIKTYFGYTITPEFELRKMLILYGGKRCGKSTLVEAWITAVLGADRACGLSFDQGNSFSFGDWQGKFVAYCDDLGAERIPDKGPLKSIVAGKRIPVNRKYQPQVYEQLSPKIIISTNNPINFEDRTCAIMDRLLIIDMSRKALEEDAVNVVPYFDDPEFGAAMLWEAVQAIKPWVVEVNGKYSLDQTKKIPVSERSQLLLKQAAQKANPITAALEAMLESGGPDALVGETWEDIQDRLPVFYKSAVGPDLQPDRIPAIDTVNATLKSTKLGEWGAFQIVKKFSAKINGKTVTIPAFMAQFSYDQKENDKYIEIAKEKIKSRKRMFLEQPVLDMNATIE